MAGLEVVPQYPVELWRFVRDPAGYVERARLPERKDVYAPWAAFGVGLALSIAIAAFDARQSSAVFEEGTEQVFQFLVAAINLALVHGLCRAIGGKATLSDSAVVFEYWYGFLVPASMALTTILIATAAWAADAHCVVSISTFNCDWYPSSVGVVIITLLQLALGAIAVYALVVCNKTVARLQRLTWKKVLAAQVLALIVLFFINGILYHVSHLVATTLGL